MKKEDIAPTVDLMESVLWQYDRAPNLRGMMEMLQEVMDLDCTGFWRWFQKNVFDIRTANMFGVSLWAAAAGVDLPQKPDEVSEEVWAAALRRYVRASVCAKWSDGTAGEICRYVQTVFGDWNFIVQDGGLGDGDPMTVSYIPPYDKLIGETTDVEEQAKRVLVEYDALFIHPAAVKSNVQKFQLDGIIALAEPEVEGEQEKSGDSPLDKGIVYGDENAVRFGWSRNVFGMNEDNNNGQFAMNLSEGTAILNEQEH